MSRRRSLLALGLASVLAACGGGGGGGGGGLEAGPLDWGVPVLPHTGFDATLLTIHNLDADEAPWAYTAYAADGSVTGSDAGVLRGFAELNIPTGLVASDPTTWIHVNTPTGRVEVAHRAFDIGSIIAWDGTFAGLSRDEATRAWPLGDLAAPPPTTDVHVTITDATDVVRVYNASAAPAAVSVTAYAAPATFGTNATATPLAALAAIPPWGSVSFEPLSVFFLFGGQPGQVVFSSAQPIFAGTRDGDVDVLDAGTPGVFDRDRTLFAEARFGRDHSVPNGFTDFALEVRNDTASSRTFAIASVHRTDGTAILATERGLSLGAFETRTILTTDPLLADLFGDATLAPGLTHASLKLFVPRGVAARVRQFDPFLHGHLARLRPEAVGHVIDVLSVMTTDVASPRTKQFVTIHNPSAAPIDVALAVIVSQRTAFDPAVLPLQTVTVPADGFSTVDVSALAYDDRDANPVSNVSLRCTSPNSFAVTGRIETRAVSGLLVTLSPLAVRVHDDAE